LIALFRIETISERTKSILKTLRNRRARGEQVAMTQIVAEEQLRLREQLMRKPKPTTTTTNDEKRTKIFFFALIKKRMSYLLTAIQEKKSVAPMKRKANELDSSISKKARTVEKVLKHSIKFLYF